MLRFLFILFLFPLFAQAGIAIEPYAGGGLAHFGEMRSGFSVGGRIGYKNWGLMSGLDIGYSQFHIFDISQKAIRTICNNNQGRIGGVAGIKGVELDQCDRDAEQDSSSVYDIFSIGPSISFGLPLIIDAYASLTWSWAEKNINNLQKSFPLSGPGVKLGVSYLSLPFLQLNIEVQGLLLSCNSLDEKCQEQNNITNPIIMGQAYISIPIGTGLL